MHALDAAPALVVAEQFRKPRRAAEVFDEFGVSHPIIKHHV